ncbi:MAG TPA: NIPSNAP family protein [Sedimentisphaerales bacterium]|nr:NIPSNAP family protein [Sedimentisphaerales bacterium]
MNRRDFIATGVAGLATTNLAGGSESMGNAAPRRFFEWRQHQLRTGAPRNLVGDFYKNVGIAAMNRAGRKKVEMFNEGVEIAIFRKTGLNPVMFGETIIGSNLPNLTYMLAFKDMAERDQRWQVFRDDPDWKKLSADPAYKDTVSNITDIILRPTEYSQI